MEKLTEVLERRMKPRPNSDCQSEVLNVIAAPIYLYTITGVFYYSAVFVMPYYYGTDDSWTLFIQRSLLLTVYVQMMSNWYCIRVVDNSLKTAVKSNQYISKQSNSYYGNSTDLQNIVIKATKEPTLSRCNGSSVTIPGPKSAPAAHTRISYWSPKYCNKCELTAPPRCHHCPFCENCVLKRDHHCFFTRRCVGFYNQRHFIVFLVWAAFGTSYTSLYFVHYFFKVLLVHMSVWDTFAPFACLRALIGYSSFHTANFMMTFTLNALFVFLSSMFVHEQYQLISGGITQFEQTKVDKKRLVISDPRPFTDKLRTVLGYNYGLSFVLPWAHLIFPPHENPFEWPEHKVYRK